MQLRHAPCSAVRRLFLSRPVAVHSRAMLIVLVFVVTAIPGKVFAQDDKDEKVTPPLSPKQAIEAFMLADDLKIDAVLTEPNVQQPVFLTFDERGRMWVCNYLQYPNPAGLKLLGRDKY